MNPADLFAAIVGAPSLPGARCRGRPHLFDPAQSHEAAETVTQRHTQALALCAACPALDRCRAWVATLTPARRPRGVIAGRIKQPQPLKGIQA